MPDLRSYAFPQNVNFGCFLEVLSTKEERTDRQLQNNGQTWRLEPEEVNMYDFPSDAQGRATPYGIYDQAANHALVMIGVGVITAAFAVASIRRWWEKYGCQRYRDSKHIMIECDGGGCNGHRPRLWKSELQKFADDTGLSITVCHYPSGASKWNPIEHRVFSQISRNWAGSPLRTLGRILGFIRGTTTKRGLKIDAEVDPVTYEKGLKISDSQMRSLNITRRRFCSELNYTIHPRQSGNS
jgi:hypothetical protein